MLVAAWQGFWFLVDLDVLVGPDRVGILVNRFSLIELDDVDSESGLLRAKTPYRGAYLTCV